MTAIFNQAFEHTMGHEGGYVNDPEDRGGETYRGIARKFWANWAGWAVVDQLKAQGKGSLAQRINQAKTQLDPHVRAFYHDNFWKSIKLDEVASNGSPALAQKIFDTAVNVGTKPAIQWLQRALNLCNRNEQDYPNLDDDGKIGSKTLEALSKARINSIYITFNLLQGEHYMNICRNNPVQKKFFNGWLNRISLSSSSTSPAPPVSDARNMARDHRNEPND
jgi:lysozyme family protein